MHIVNIMLSAIGGGIEQAFVDYCEGLQARGHTVTAVTHPDAVINPQLLALGIAPFYLRNFGEYDPFAIMRLRRKLQAFSPDVVLAHTGRSFALARFAGAKRYKLVGVAHNYNSRTSRLSAADAVFTTTHDLMAFLAQHGIPQGRIFHVPNMVRADTLPRRGMRNKPPVIGAMGRFVKKKGFDVYIDALKILKDRGYIFRAILGGEGEENRSLQKRAQSAGLGDVLSMPGWIADKKAFYTHADIFCLPSLHEPFGIVLLEAFVYGAPVVSSDAEGPGDIITNGVDALLVKKGDAEALADALAKLLDDPQAAATLAANAFVKAKTHYSIESVSERIEKALLVILGRTARCEPGIHL